MSSNSTTKRKWRLKSKLHRQIDIAVTIGIDRYTAISLIKKSLSVGKELFLCKYCANEKKLKSNFAAYRVRK